MFKSITSFVKQAKGPRAILASQIAKALSEHFVLDPDDIESSLLNETRIVLKNTQLRERRYKSANAPNAVISVHGTVAEVIFSWKWNFSASGMSFSGGTASSASAGGIGGGSYASGKGMVQDVMLTIKGLKVHVDLQAWDTLDKLQQDLVEDLESSSPQDDTVKDSYMQTYIQEVVDHLTLKVEDFQLVVQANGGPSVNIAGEDIELGTLASAKIPTKQEGVETTTILSQKLSICSFSMNVKEKSSEETVPLFEPFGYAASVTRLSGVRFQGGILSGLEVIGLPDELSAPTVSRAGNKDNAQKGNDIFLHIGSQQVRALSAIGMLLAPASSAVDAPRISGDSRKDDGDKGEGSESTIFNLPLPCLNLVLPSSTAGAPTNIQLPNCQITYRTDGEVFLVKGKEGITSNGHPLVDLGEDGEWSIDCAGRKLILKGSKREECKDCSIVDVRAEDMQKIISSATQILESDDVANLQDAWMVKESTSSDHSQDQPSKPWFISTGSIILRLSNNKSKWIEAEVDHFRANLVQGAQGYLQSDMKVGGIMARSFLDRDTQITIPPFSVHSGSLHISDSVEASVGSYSEIEELKSLLLSFAEIGQKISELQQKTTPSVLEREGFSFPLPVRLDLVKAIIRDVDLDLYLTNLHGEGTKFECEKIIYTEGLSRFEVEEIHIEFRHFSGIAESSSEIQDKRQSADSSINADLACKKVGFFLYERPDRTKLIGAMRSSSVRIKVSMIGSLIEAEIVQKLGLRIEGPAKEWIEGYVDASKVRIAVQNLFLPISFETLGASITSSSLGEITVNIPPSLMETDKEKVEPIVKVGQSLDETVEIHFGSIDTLQQMQSLLLNISGQGHPKPSSDEKISFPFQMKIQMINLSFIESSILISAEATTIESNCINIAGVSCSGPRETKCMLRGVDLNVGTAIQVKIQTIEKVVVPHIFEIVEPIKSSSISFENDSLNIVTDVAKIQMLETIVGKQLHNEAEGGGSAEAEDYDIPFPTQFHVKRLFLKSLPKEDIKVQIVGVKMCLTSNDGIINVDTEETMHLRIAHANQHVDCSIQPSFVALPSSLQDISAMNFGGGSIDSCSLGLLRVVMPSCTILPDTNTVAMNDTLGVQIGSLDLAQNIQAWISSALQSNPTSSEQFSTTLPEIGIQLSKLSINIQNPPMGLIGTQLIAQGEKVSCASLDVQESSGMRASMKGVSVFLEAGYHLQIDAVNHFVVPGLMALSAPAKEISVLYTNDSVAIHVNDIHAVAHQQHDELHGSTSSKTNLSLPAPVTLNTNSFIITDVKKRYVLSVNNIGMSANQSGSTILLRTREGMTVKLQKHPDEWITSTLGSLSVLVQQENGSFKVPQKLELSGARLGPCSYGQLSIAIPPVSQHQNSTLLFRNSITLSVQNIDVMEKLRHLFDNLSSDLSGAQNGTDINTASTFDKLPFPIEIPGIQMSLSTPTASLQIESISCASSTIDINRVQVVADGIISSTMKNLRVDILSHQLTIGCIEALSIPSTMSLSCPLLNLVSRYDQGGLSVHASSPVHVDILSPDAPVIDSNTEQSEIEIPFPIKIGIVQAFVKTQSEQDGCVKLQQIALELKPTVLPQKDFLSAHVKKVTSLSLVVGDVVHPLFQARNIITSLMLRLNDTNTVHRLNVSLDSAQITAGFSSVDWSSLLHNKTSDGQVPRKVISIPFANIDEFSLSVSYQGAIVSSAANIAVPEFVGNSITTSEDVISHFSNIAIKRVPGFLSNAEVLGSNVVDGTMANLGRMAMSKSVKGAAMGGILGTVASDSLKGAIKAGKSSRNVGADESYKFGDISRGIVRGLSTATEVGASSRGGDGNDYVPGDLTVGVAKATGEYVGNNKGKLASAGGSGIGSMVGLAVAGPLGFVAGSYFGSKAGKSITVEDAGKKKETDRVDNAFQHRQHPLPSEGNYGQDYQTISRGISNRMEPNQVLNQSNQGISKGTQSSDDVFGIFATPSNHEQESTIRSDPFSQLRQPQVSHQQQQKNGNHSYEETNQPLHQPNHNGSTQFRQEQVYSRQQQLQNHHTVQQSSLSQYQASQNANVGHQSQQGHQHVNSRQQQSYNHSSTQQASQNANVGYQYQQGHQQVNSRQQQSYNHRSAQQAQPQYHQPRSQYNQTQQAQTQQQQDNQGYKFGSITKGILAKGKESDGRSKKDGYKFGDFSRGLFK